VPLHPYRPLQCRPHRNERPGPAHMPSHLTALYIYIYIYIPAIVEPVRGRLTRRHARRLLAATRAATHVLRATTRTARGQAGTRLGNRPAARNEGCGRVPACPRACRRLGQRACTVHDDGVRTEEGRSPPTSLYIERRPTLPWTNIPW
jgi:hypothetical protein